MAEPHPSAVRVSVNGVPLGLFDLPDDPADHRGLLSWHAQERGEKPRLDEAGSYGYLVEVSVPAAAVAEAVRAGEFVVRLKVDATLPGGLAVYGGSAGRYPVDPSLVRAQEFGIRVGALRGSAPVPSGDLRAEDPYQVGLNYATPFVQLRTHELLRFEASATLAVTEVSFALGGRLDFDNAARSGHDEIRIRMRGRILGIIEIEHRRGLEYPA